MRVDTPVESRHAQLRTGTLSCAPARPSATPARDTGTRNKRRATSLKIVAVETFCRYAISPSLDNVSTAAILVRNSSGRLIPGIGYEGDLSR